MAVWPAPSRRASPPPAWLAVRDPRASPTSWWCSTSDDRQRVGAAHRGQPGVSPDQGTWVITSYSVAEAICVPLTGWLVPASARSGPSRRDDRLRDLLDAVRPFDDARHARRLPHRPGHLRRPDHAADADAAAGGLPAGKARPGHGPVGDDDRRRADRWARCWAARSATIGRGTGSSSSTSRSRSCASPDPTSCSARSRRRREKLPIDRIGLILLVCGSARSRSCWISAATMTGSRPT
jgi:hypothetical protein